VGNREVKGTFSEPPRNRFYGFWSYGRDPKKTFATRSEAKDFDDNRFTDVPFARDCSGPRNGNCKLVETTWANVTYDAANPAMVATTCSQAVAGQTDCKAVPEDAGWFYEYGSNCPLKTCGPPPPWSDEKTGAGATVVLGCTAWGGFRPVGAATSVDPCSGSVGAPVTYGYVAHFVSGIPTASCGYAENGRIYRAVQRSTTAPPTAATVRVTFSPTGEIAYSTLQIDAGAAPGSKTMGTRSEIGEPVYWLEVPRQLHSCRHVAGSGACE
jgi:type IV pilus assembly protein PilY1